MKSEPNYSNDEFNARRGWRNQWAKQLNINSKLGFLPTPPVHPVYGSWRPEESLFDLIKAVLGIVEKFKILTVRQVYYQLVSMGLLKRTTEKEAGTYQKQYGQTDYIVKRMRRSGMISYYSIVDDTRTALRVQNYASIEECLRIAIDKFRTDWNVDDRYYVEVFLEKRALWRVFWDVTNFYNIMLVPCGGNDSDTSVHRAAERLKNAIHRNQRPEVLFFSDLDPSGSSMPVEIESRLRMLGVVIPRELDSEDTKIVQEIALTPEQVEQYDLVKLPMKRDDQKKESFIRKHGVDFCCELDALNPDVLKGMVNYAILRYVNAEKINSHRSHDRLEVQLTLQELEPAFKRLREGMAEVQHYELARGV